MIEKFKALTTWKKIVVGILGLFLLPIALVALSANLLIQGIKSKNMVKIGGGAFLTMLAISFAIHMYTPTDDIEETPEIENKQESTEPVKQEDFEVEIEETMENEDGKVRFNITTNLPDTTELMISVTELNNGEYRGQTKVTVMNGEAQTEWFSNKGDALRNGEYELSISMSLPRLQSEEVQAVVGENGEFMKGEYVEKGEIEDAYYISKTTTITLSEGASAEAKVADNEEHKQIVAQFYNELKSEYYSQLSSYNELEFGQFIADWNRRRNEAQAKMDEEDPLMEYSIAMRELIVLETEMRNKLAGRDYDEQYINDTMKSVEGAIK